jgi:hypothetical protein
MALDGIHAPSFCSLNDFGWRAAETFNFFVILASCSAFDDTLLNYVFLFLPCFLKVAVLLWQSNAEFLSTALIESVRCKGFDGLALLGRP